MQNACCEELISCSLVSADRVCHLGSACTSCHVWTHLIEYLTSNVWAVLVSNFGGSTSALLSVDGGRLAGRLKLDALYPVAGHKRCLDTQNGYGARKLSQHCFHRGMHSLSF